MKGVYVLVISVSRSLNVRVYARKKFSLEAGFYAYVGSAQKCLEKRLMRHFRKAGKRRFWHIDHLLVMDCANVIEAFYKEAEKAEECKTAQSLSVLGFPVEGFGCSDCKCRSHLFRFNNLRHLEGTCLKLGFKPFALSC